MKGQQRRQIEALRNRAMRVGAGAKLSKLTDNEVAAQMQRARDAFLASPEWKALKARTVAKYGAKCMCCGAVPRRASHINADHIKPRKFYPELALDEDNIQLLCGRCNKRKGNGPAIDYRPNPAAAMGLVETHRRYTA